MSERLNLPPTRESVLRDYAELLTYGVPHDDAARRLGVTPEQLAVWVKSAEEVTARRRRAS